MADAFDPQHAERLADPARLAALPQAVVVSLLRLTGDETVVDYGAGTGVYTIPIAEALPDGRVIAVEALSSLVEMMRAKITPEIRDRLQLVETDTNTVPVPDGVADRVVMVDVLHPGGSRSPLTPRRVLRRRGLGQVPTAGRPATRACARSRHGARTCLQHEPKRGRGP
jgi:protein-L-isoaspartate O-methyltransferase